jgi:putative membrane protein
MLQRGRGRAHHRGGSIVRYVYIGLIVAFTALVLLFKVQNLETVTVSLFSASLSLPVSVLLLGIYLLGMFTGGFLLALLRSWIGGARGRN